MDTEIRRVLAEHGRLSVEVTKLSDEANLFQVGMTSHANVNVMLALEEAFNVEFPEAALRRSTFESIAAIRARLTDLLAAEGR